MQKTFASLLVTLAVCVWAIGFAYVFGQRSAEQRIREDVTRSEAKQQALVEELRRDLAPRAGAAGVDLVDGVEVVDAAGAGTDASGADPVLAASGGADAADETLAAPDSEARAAVGLGAAVPRPGVDSISEPESAVVEAIVEATTAQEPPAPPVARESFDAIALGAAYPEVARKFGREGRAALTMEEAGGVQTKQYVWQWAGPAGEACRAEMRFVDGRLTDKNFRG